MAEENIQTNQQSNQEPPIFDPSSDEIAFVGSQEELKKYNEKMGSSEGGTGHSAKPDDAQAAGSQTAPGASEGEDGQTPPETPTDGAGETPTPEEGVQSATPEEEAAGSQEGDGLSDEEYFETISQSTGLQIENDDQIVDTIVNLNKENETLRTENEELKNKGPAIPEDMSDLLKQAYEYEKKGGNVRTFLSIVNQDTQSMSQKELIRQQFFNDHPEYVSISPEFANQKFERDFNQRFGLVNEERTEDDFEDDISYLKWQDDKRFAKSELDFEAKKAANSIDAMKAKIINEEPQQPASQQPEVDEEALKAIQEKYLSQANEFKADFEAIEIPLDAKGEKSFNIGLNNKTKPQFEQWVDSPPDFFEHIGISKDGKTIDMDVFGAHVALTAAFEATGDASVGAMLTKHILENFNQQTLESQLENPEQTPPVGASQASEMTDEEEALSKLSQAAAGPYKPVYLPIKDDKK
jgi:hypothetical protein